MTKHAWLQAILDWTSAYALNLGLSLFAVIVYVVIVRLALPKIEKSVGKSKLKEGAVLKAYHIVRAVSATITLAAILVVWGIDFSGLLVLSTSIITLTGVALFASWSLLSNITAYFLLLFHDSFRRGNFVRVIDADNYIEGYISEVNLFNTKILTEDREVIVYPNNLILTRPTIVNPRVKWQTMGKIMDKSNSVEKAAQLPNNQD
ncbi:mechanosensitive ion channel domain-containing protein [Agaribacter flavus]|uniref:Small-conductance mechanosensitive channel n=1 Tax=Agaribacter flavus TaxID=1902781 RepID=A0ABV7FVB3_9ALTE